MNSSLLSDILTCLKLKTCLAVFQAILAPEIEAPGVCHPFPTHISTIQPYTIRTIPVVADPSQYPQSSPKVPLDTQGHCCLHEPAQSATQCGTSTNKETRPHHSRPASFVNSKFLYPISSIKASVYIKHNIYTLRSHIRGTATDPNQQTV